MTISVPNVINRNLPGFGLNEFTLNHVRIYPKSNLRLCNIRPNIFTQELSVISSAKLDMSDFETKKSLSFMKMLNNTESRIDPYGIP